MEEDGVTLGTVKYSISLSNTGKHGWLHLALDLSRAIGNSWCNDSYHVNFAFNCRSDLRQTVRQHRILGTLLSSGQSLFGSIFLLPLFYFAGAKIFRRRIGDVFDVFTMCTVTTLLSHELHVSFQAVVTECFSQEVNLSVGQPGNLN